MEPTISREFYYIQMEKYARQALSEGIKNAEDLHVSVESELYRVLNLHYNRNNHIEVSQSWPSQSKDKLSSSLHSLCLSYILGSWAELSDNLVLQVPHRFRWVVEQTLKEFFKAIQAGKDLDPSWKKQIYKIIARLDDYVPEYFKSQAFLEQLE